ncbi:MAG: PPC domain-containing protein [Planctomycetia bacterium]|nr:PPC domain-containing protein [Planctomycetia bacterium]
MLLRLLSSLCVLCVLGGEIFAAPPTIETLAPGVGQRGTEFTLTLTGARLTDPQELMLYAPGVVCTKLSAKNENQVTVTLKAAPDCKLGEYPFRLRTPGGVSELRIFRISPFPIVAEKEPNDTTPQSVPLNVSLTGITESGGVDRFAVTLTKGERLSLEVEAIRLGGELNDTAITVFGPDGKEIATVDDTPLFRQDPTLSLLVPTDGVYTVEVRETNYGGSDTSRYVLHIGNFLRPAAIFPAGGQAGTEVKVKLFDHSRESTLNVKLPPAGTPFDFHATDGVAPAAPTPNRFRVSPFPNVIETEPNDETKLASAAVAWPVAFNGLIEKVGDVDHYRFRAAKGEVIDVEAFAYRIGSPLDPVVAVFHPNGVLLAGNDDDETHDSRVQVTIPTDGEYIVRVTDKRKQAGPRFIYRVELTKPSTGLAVFLPPLARKTQDRQVIAVPRGNRVIAYIGVRRDGFTGPVTVTPGELPAGVKVNIPVIPTGEYLMPVVFEAAPDAPLGGKLVAFTGRGGDAKSPVTGHFSQVVTLIQAPGDSAFHAVELSRLAVVVVEETPYSVSVVPPTTALVPDGTLDITVKVKRAKDFAEPLEVFFPSLPPGVEAPTSVVIAPDKSEAVVTLVGHPPAELGDWRLLVEVKIARAARVRDPFAAPMGGGRRPRRSVEDPPVSSEVIVLLVAKPAINGQFAPSAGEQGKTIQVVCKLDSATPAGSSFTAKLDGLPPRATAKPVEVKPGTKEVEFLVTIDPTTPPGEYRSLVCELAGTVGGQKVVYRIGRGASLKIDAPGAIKTDPSGKPLSPLEALREKEKEKKP